MAEIKAQEAIEEEEEEEEEEETLPEVIHKQLAD